MSDDQITLDSLALPLHGSRLIEASAGTGKTFTIAMLYVRLVLGHNPGGQGALPADLLPPNILVVTFTDAAAGELRERIRSRLTEAAAVFNVNHSIDSKKGEAWKQLCRLRDNGFPDPAHWPACRRRLLLAAEWMDESAISTIHAWCKRMLSEHAFDSGSLFRLTLARDQREVLRDVVRDYWRTHVYGMPEVLLTEVTEHWKTPEALYGSVRYLIGKGDLPTPSGSLNEIAERVRTDRQQVLSEIKRPWVDWVDELDTLFEQKKAENGGKLPMHASSAKSLNDRLADLRHWVESDEPKPADIKTAKKWQNLTQEALQEKWKGDNPPEHSALQAVEQLAQQFDVLPVARGDVLIHAAAWISARFEIEKLRRAEMGFDDLLTRLDAGLRGERGAGLAATIRRQFPVALIDEFQDTDPVQYRIFEQIYQPASNPAETCLLMIGDPKQAIYSFRGADIFTYLSARRAVGDRIDTLATNYRSSDRMVSATNHVFSQADQNRGDGAFLFGSGPDSPVPFVNVEAAGTARQWQIKGQAEPPMTLWQMPESDDKDKAGQPKPVSKERAVSVLSEVCAQEIARLLIYGQQDQAGFVDQAGEVQAVRPKDIAVLVNDRKEAARVREALRARGVRSVFLSDRDSVLASPQAAELLAWVRAFAEPRRLSLTRAALASPSLGLSWQALDRLLSDERVLEREIERFMGYQQCWQDQGILPTIRRFLLDFDVPGRLLGQPAGERELTDILHLAELLQRDSQHLDGEQALIHHFADQLRNAEPDNEAFARRLESDAELVKVVTVHKSKGLQYPLVFFPFATLHKAQDGKRDFVQYHDSNGELITQWAPEAEHTEMADQERLGEDVRKLYVALTRAEHALWVGVAPVANWHRSGLGYLTSYADASNAKPALDACLQKLVEASSDLYLTDLPSEEPFRFEPQAPESLGPALQALRPAAENWWIASYSAITYQQGQLDSASAIPDAQSRDEQDLLEGEGETVAVVDGVGSRRDQHSFYRGAGPGTFLHDALEWSAQHGFANLRSNPEPLRDWLAIRCESRGWGDWVEGLERWLLAIIEREFALPADGQNAPSLALAKLQAPVAEMEFWIESNNVDTLALDALVTRHILPGQARPQASANRFNGMLKGFIDLVFEHGGRYYVLDYKSNHLGPDNSAYSREAMAGAILAKRYDLQYVLYTLALHRLLASRLADYDYDQHMGGAVYLFLRGCEAETAGAFVDRPPRQLIEALDKLFAGSTAVAA